MVEQAAEEEMVALQDKLVEVHKSAAVAGGGMRRDATRRKALTPTARKG